LTERSRELRLDRLREAEQASQLDALSAEIVADAATRDGGGEIRIAASRVVLKHANEPLVVAGLLRALPRAARTKALAELVTAVSTRGIPPAGSERFAVEARRALLERLLELLGAITDADVDRQARRLAEEYWLLIPDGSEVQITDENSGEQAVMASGRVYDMVLGRARQVLPGQTAPISLETVERRHTARMSASLGLIQRFAADQIGTAEALAYLVACERPANAAAAGRVLERLAERRRSGGPESASHIFTQLKHTQDAILDLMLLLTKDGRS